MSVVHNLTNYLGICPPNFQVKKKDSRNLSTEQQAIVIACYIHKCQVLGQIEPPPDRISEIVGWFVKDFLNGNSDKLSVLTEILENKQLKEKTHEQIIENVLNAMFADGKFNWGRVSATYAFGVKYCLKYCYDENGNEPNSSSSTVMHFIGVYVGQHLGHWIKMEGGWEAMTSLYPNERAIMKQLRSVGFLALTVGLGSLINVLSS